MYTLNDFVEMRGFSALTQGDARIEEMLVENANKLGGKAQGFYETRLYCLTKEFDREALEAFVEMSIEISKGNVMLDETMKNIARHLLERIFRHHVPLDTVETFCHFVMNRISFFNNDVEKAIDSFERYFTCGKVVPVMQSYKEALKEIEKGEILYYEPVA
jgi:hypothetical protein